MVAFFIINFILLETFDTSGKKLMKQIKLAPLTIGVMLLAGTAVVSAAQGPYIGPTVGYYGFDGDRDNGTINGQLATPNKDDNADDGVFYGLSLGYQFNDHFALEFNYSRLDSEANVAGTDTDGKAQTKGSNVDGNMFRLDGLFSMPLSKSFSPYFVMGYTRLNLDPDFTNNKHNMVDLGAGAKYSFTKAISLRGDVRGFFEDGFSDYGVNVGLFYLLDTTPPAKKAPEIDQCALDDDNDGVGNCDDTCPGTVAGDNIDTNGCAIIEKAPAQPISLTLEIHFASGKHFISPEYFPELEKVADALKKYSDATAEIAGHTDSRGRAKSNQRLSERRANAVRDALIAEFGIDGSRITAVGYGESDPIADNSTREGRAQNRRVVGIVQ
jgi:OOP family OmpA-OmpF porin